MMVRETLLGDDKAINKWRNTMCGWGEGLYGKRQEQMYKETWNI